MQGEGGEAAAMEFRILGRLEVLRDERRLDLGGRRQQALLAFLVIEANRVVSLERLVDELWPGEPPARATAGVQSYVSRLRRILEPERPPAAPARVLLTQPPGYRLRVDDHAVDAIRFERLAESGRQALATGDAERARALLGEALALFRGPALEEFAAETFARAEAARLEELRIGATEDRYDAVLALGRHHDVLGDLEAAVGAAPVRERLRGQLMVALYRAGRPADALAAYEDGKRRLGEELGLDPSPALRFLARAIAAQERDLDWRMPAAPAVRARPSVPEERGAVSSEEGVSPGLAGGSLLGRDSELALLERRLNEALSGQGRLVLVAGEAGIGKTRLAQALAEMASARGAEVVWGRGYEGEGAPAFWPWIQVVRALMDGDDPQFLQAALGAGAAHIAQVVPEVQAVVDEVQPAPASDPAVARFRLYEALARFLARLAARQPLILLLDDLHEADAPSVDLLGFLAAQWRDAPLLVAGFYREEEIHGRHPLAAGLTTLGYEPVVTRLRLRGLGPAAVGRLLAEALGSEPAEALVSALHARTEGNPFFLRELVRLLGSRGELSGVVSSQIPEGVRAVIGRRLARLPEATTNLLRTAAVIGREFDLGVLERAERLDPELVLRLVEPAVVTGLVTEDPDVPGRCRFAHALVRETLYDELAPLRRARLRGRLGEVLEERYGPDDGPHLVELAHHFFLAAPMGASEKALLYATRAAAWSTAHLAYEQAEEHLRRALELLRRLPPSPDRARQELDVQRDLSFLLMTTKGNAAPEGGAGDRGPASVDPPGPE
jgi:DNA-binding SARP family transcriptional activator